MRRKRGLVLTVALLLVLAACGEEDAETPQTTEPASSPTSTEAEVGATTTVGAAEPQTITFWHYWDGLNGEVIAELAARYAEETGVTVEPTFFGYGDLLTKLLTTGGGAEGPDLAIADLVWMPKLAESGALVALDEYVDAGGVDVDDFYSELLGINRYGGQLYGLPVSTNNLELFYNKALFESAGLDPESPPTNWDELRTAAAACADPGSGVTGMELYTEPGEGLTWQFQVYLWQAGGEFLNDDLTAAAFNSPEGAAALQYWVDLIDSGESGVVPWGQFGQGAACMAMDGSWMVGIWSADPPFEFGTASMPYPSDGNMATNMGGEQGFIMATDPAVQQAAFDFLAWFTSPEIQVEWDQRTGFMPVRASVAEDPDYLSYIESNEPRYLPFVESQQYARSRPAVSVYPEISDAFSRELERALLGDASVAEALAAAETAVNELLGG
ncbi:MAG TPA: ABC transporter substrate-binding protein [Acidimicrobiia bacterium]|nr:ABC transporter substrate-binding protein [Acidimicrobiia bacterium]